MSRFFSDADLYFGDPFAYRVNQKRLKIARKLVGHILSHYRIKSVLDIGCGEGYFVENVYGKSCAAKGITLVLIEPEEQLISSLAKRLKGVLPVRSKAEAIPLARNTFDLVVLWGVLDHVKDVRKALEEIALVLQPGGRTLILTNNFWRSRSYDTPDEMGHWHAFSARALHNALRHAGFEVERTWGNGFPAQIMLDRPARMERWLTKLPGWVREFLNGYGLGDRWYVLNPYAPALLNGGLRTHLATMMGRLWPSKAFDHICVAKKRR